MTITEAQRSALYESMKTVHGADITEAIMNAYPTSSDDEAATKRDLDQLQAVTRSEMAELRTGLQTETAQLRTDMADLRTELRTDVADLRTDMHRGFAAVKSDLTRTLGTWIFASQAGVVAAVALVVGLLG